MKKVKEKLESIAFDFIVASIGFTAVCVITTIIGAIMGKKLEWVSYK